MRSVVFMVLVLGGCNMIVPPTTAPRTTAPLTTAADTPTDIKARLLSADGSDRGQATLRLVDGRMRVFVDAVGLSPGARGVHIHEVGRCEGPDFASAKGHWNPSMKMHGRDNPMGAHHGDLPNLMIGTDGRGTVAIDVPGSVAALLDADGASVIIHADADDYKTDPSGNSGGRIACGVLTAP